MSQRTLIDELTAILTEDEMGGAPAAPPAPSGEEGEGGEGDEDHDADDGNDSDDATKKALMAVAYRPRIAFIRYVQHIHHHHKKKKHHK